MQFIQLPNFFFQHTVNVIEGLKNKHKNTHKKKYLKNLRNNNKKGIDIKMIKLI